MNPVLFYILSAFLIISSLFVVRVRNIFYAALCLGMTFFGVAGIYLTLQAEFLAGLQIMIYVGAITVLILFAVMLTAGIQRKLEPPFSKISPLALLAVTVSAALVGMIIYAGFWGSRTPSFSCFSTGEIGMALLKHFMIPFELVSVLLLAALIGAVVIARKEDSPPEGNSESVHTKEELGDQS